MLGSEHPETAISMRLLCHTLSSQGYALSRQGRHEEAETMARQALGLREQALHPNHPDILRCVALLGHAFHSQGKYEKAESMARQVFEARMKALGPEHPDILRSVNNLRCALTSQGNMKRLTV